MMRKYDITTTWGRKLSTWGVSEAAAERRIAADLERAGEGEEVYRFASGDLQTTLPRDRGGHP